MVRETWSSVEEFEKQVTNTTRSKQQYELRLIENVLNGYLGGFRALNEFKTGEIGKLELAWLLLVVRSFNSLRCAYDLLQRGHYIQSVMLIRSVEEDYLTCRYCIKHTETIDALLEGKGKLGKDELRFSEMAKRISPQFYEHWKHNYGNLSEIYHPRPLALGMVAKWEDNRINLGAGYNENHFIATCHALLKSAAGLIEFMVRLLGDRTREWKTGNYAAFEEAAKYVKQISEKYGDNDRKDSLSSQ